MIVQDVSDEIILQENEKLVVKDETHDNIDDEVNKNQIYKH